MLVQSAIVHSLMRQTPAAIRDGTTAVSTLTIRHVVGSNPPAFQVVHQDGRAAGPFEIESPTDRQVEGRPTSNLLGELRWYLETFLDYPFPPETEHVERVRQALRQWGKDAFNSLFDSRQTGSWFEDAIKGGLEKLSIRVTSDDPLVLGWPWETLEDEHPGTLAQTCRIERRLNELASPVELPNLPDDRVNVLLVVARPYEGDVRFGSVARPLIELVESKRLPVDVRLLRPPTFAQLQRHLQDRPGYYHLVHFDGHGGYGEKSSEPQRAGSSVNPYRYEARGVLVFEDDEGKPDEVEAETLSTLLREHRIPAIVLNACRSATVDERAADQFASVATSLLKAGIRNVVAMSHTLYVTAAQEFLPAFYERLFETGQFDEAVRAGRRQLFKEQGRVCARGLYDLEDWLVPVVYAQGAEVLSFAARGRPRRPPFPKRSRLRRIPTVSSAATEHCCNWSGAMHRAPGVLLVRGLGGVGKTTLAAGFVEWLLRTDGLQPEELFWFRFDEIRNADYVPNQIGERFFGDQIRTVAAEPKLTAVIAALKKHRCLIVWDNFESVHGIEGTSVTPKLDETNRDLLARGLYEGASKILLTSRSPETWLEKRHRFPLTLAGLVGEERWELCARIIRDQGLTVDRDNPALKELLDLLDGHPLAMRVVLPELEGRSAESVLTRLKDDVGSFATSEIDETEQKLFATLRFATEQLPEDLRPLLVPLALHDHFVDADYLERMAKAVDDKRWSRAQIDGCLRALSSGGLVQDRIAGRVFELHPLLTRYLALCIEPDDAWTRAFVDFFENFADQIAPKPLHEQRGPFYVHGANFHTARREAERPEMEEHYDALTQSQAAYVQNTHDYAEAERLFTELAESSLRRDSEDHVAAAYHQLGNIAQDRLAFDAAERWYRKTLKIQKRLGDEHGAARTIHALGSIAFARRKLDEAELFYLQSLEITERLSDDDLRPKSYHQVGLIAQEQRAFDAAERWYFKSLEINERLGNEHGAAMTYGQLGLLAQSREDFSGAARWFIKCLVAFYAVND
jgi:tetratricopeptide (TPR) repeat protein